MIAREELLLHSERLIIRHWRREDYHTMDQWPSFDDPLSVVWNLPGQVTAQRGVQRLDVRRIYAITLRDHSLIGRLTLRDIERKQTSSRLGITIGSPYVSQGYGTEALSCFLDAYFTQLGFSTMLLDVAALNERAVRCYQRLGFQITNTHWRDGGNRFIQLLSESTRKKIEPYIRYGRHTVWVQFYDMQLAATTWKQQRQTSHYIHPRF